MSAVLAFKAWIAAVRRCTPSAPCRSFSARRRPSPARAYAALPSAALWYPTAIPPDPTSQPPTGTGTRRPTRVAQHSMRPNLLPPVLLRHRLPVHLLVRRHAQRARGPLREELVHRARLQQPAEAGHAVRRELASHVCVDLERDHLLVLERVDVASGERPRACLTGGAHKVRSVTKSKTSMPAAVAAQTATRRRGDSHTPPRCRLRRVHVATTAPGRAANASRYVALLRGVPRCEPGAPCGARPLQRREGERHRPSGSNCAWTIEETEITHMVMASSIVTDEKSSPCHVRHTRRPAHKA